MNEIRIDVCVVTFRRPELLSGLLESLTAQVLDGLTMRIVVIDNDSLESARETVEAFRLKSYSNVCYDVEPTQGISYARNRALENIAAEYAAYIDDDEVAPPNWLQTMWQAINKYQADVVFGPVVGQLQHDAPKWAYTHPSFARTKRTSGATLRHGASGNVFFNVKSLGCPRQLFDPAYALSGGEDSDFFMRLHIAGCRLVWCEEAAVSEEVPATRTTISWVCRRAFRGGQSFARIFVKRYSITMKVIWIFYKPLQIISAALVLPLLLPVFPAFVRLLCRICAATGQLSSLLGDAAQYQEYIASRYR